jgi:hypothetical protein
MDELELAEAIYRLIAGPISRLRGEIMDREQIAQIEMHLKTIQDAINAIVEVGTDGIAGDVRRLNEAAQELEGDLSNIEPGDELDDIHTEVYRDANVNARARSWCEWCAQQLDELADIAAEAELNASVRYSGAL